MRLIFQGGRTFYVYICFYAVATCPSISSHINKRDTVQFPHLQTYFQNNEPLHCPKATLNISLRFLFFIIFFTYTTKPSLHFTLLFISTIHFPSLYTFIAFTSPH